jgi:cysteine synthase A
MNQGILSAIGRTPMIELTHIFRDTGIHFVAKMEQFNPGGSTKDRPALNIVQHGMATGAIRPGTIIIESSSGNMGIGLAQACAYYKLRFICVVDVKTTAQNIDLLKAYNAEVEVVTEPDPVSGEYLPARIVRVKELQKLFHDSFWPNQYASEHNSNAHHQTMHEIVTALDGKLDYLFCAISTCGTLRGCAEYKKRYRLSARIVAVDAVGSVIFGGRKCKRLIPGHGAAVVPPLYRDDLADEYVQVSDLDCVVGCHRLVQEEAFLAGGSSGAIISAVEQFIPKMPPGSTCVAVLPDRGERYLDTIYSREWIAQHFGDVFHLWTSRSETYASITATL